MAKTVKLSYISGCRRERAVERAVRLRGDRRATRNIQIGLAQQKSDISQIEIHENRGRRIKADFTQVQLQSGPSKSDVCLR